MTDELLQDLAQYKTSKDKSELFAANLHLRTIYYMHGKEQFTRPNLFEPSVSNRKLLLLNNMISWLRHLSSPQGLQGRIQDLF